MPSSASTAAGASANPKKQLGSQWNLFTKLNALLSFLLSFLFTYQDPVKLPHNSEELVKQLNEQRQSSLWNLLSFSWVNTLMNVGSKKIVGEDDLIDVPKDVIDIDKVASDYEKEFQETKSILGALHRLIGKEYYLCALPKLVSDIMILASPFLMREILNSIESATSGVTTAHTIRALTFSFLFLLSKVMQTVMLQVYWYVVHNVAIKTRIALSSAVFRKAMKLNNSARQGYQTAEIVNLVAHDANRAKNILFKVHDSWSGVLKIICTLIFLYQAIGFKATSAGVVIMSALIPINFSIKKRQEKLIIKHDELKDSRLKIVQEILTSIRVLKQFTWETLFLDKITSIRSEELSTTRRHDYLGCVLTFFFQSIPFLMSFVCFMVYTVVLGNSLTVSTAFTVLSLLSTLTQPLYLLPSTFVGIIELKAMMQRINRFMNLEEVSPTPIVETSKDDIVFANASFTWKKNTQTHLKSVSLACKSKMVVVIGKVGNGKTSLLSALLGEMVKLDGYVSLSTSNIAYVPQQAYIRNATVRDNILFGSPYDAELYQKVISACALKTDFMQFPLGDLTEIGARGVSLSGGQKARINLARAVYKNCDIYLLDDVLAAVDSQVGKHILDNVIFGLLKDKTRVVNSHQLHFLERADHVVVMKGGEIIQQGAYSELMSQQAEDNYLRSLVKEYVHHESEDSHEEETSEETQIIAEDNLLHPPTTLHHRVSESMEEQEEEEKDAQVVAHKEKKIQGGISLASIVDYVSHALHLGIILIIMNILKGFTDSMVNDWVSRWSADSKLEHHSQNYYIAIYCLLGISKCLFTLIYTSLGVMFCKKIAEYYHDRLIRGVLFSKINFFDKTPSGTILSRFGSDMEVVDTNLGWKVRNFLDALCSLLLAVILIIYKVPLVVVVGIPFGYVYYYLQDQYRKTSREINRLNSLTKPPIYSHLAETLDGLPVIRAFHSQNMFLKENLGKIYKHIKVNFALNYTQRWFELRVEIIGWMIVFICTVLALLGQVSKPEDASALGVLLSRTLNLADLIGFFVHITAETESSFSSAERIQEFSNLDSERYQPSPNFAEPAYPYDVEHDSAEAEDWPKEGSIEFQDIWMKYEESQPPTLKGVSMQIKPQQKVAIVGRSGAGKTSILNAFFRLNELSAGKIVIDGKDIGKLPLHTLRNSIAIIPQDPILLVGKLRNSLDPMQQYNNEQIWQALELCNMKKKIERMPDKLDTYIAENTVSNFSVGEKQLLCLARALLRNKKILALDEATASVDVKTDALIQATIRNEFKHCTIICIAHRLDSIMDYNMVAVMQAGRLVEYDSPANLLAAKRNQNSKTLFMQMVEQTGEQSTQRLKRIASMNRL